MTAICKAFLDSFIATWNILSFAPRDSSLSLNTFVVPLTSNLDSD